MDDMWKIVMITPIADINKDIYYINYITIGMMLISLIGVLLLVLMLNRHIINPILLLNTFAKKVEEGDLEIKATENRKDEIGQLGHGFNNMLVNLKKHIANVKEKERLKSKLEIKVLQSQINPHFIRNSLNVIRWMAELLNAPSISKAIMSFVRIMDYYLDSPDAMVTVRKEMECLNEYIYLQKLKYQNKFSTDIDIDEDIMDCHILKLILQPIVENSIIHGLDKKKGLGSLCIKGFKRDDKLIFIIKDDGIGMDDATLRNIFQLKPSTERYIGISGIGIANVQQRVHLYYGEAFGLMVSSAPDKGTEVVVIIPSAYTDSKEDGSNENTNS
jgi:two-component system sensor histidine kinase YesM